MSEVKKIGNHAFVDTVAGTYALAFSHSLDESSMVSSLILNGHGAWENYPAIYGGAKVVPFGADNNLPAAVRQLLEKNNLGPGILARKTGLQYGQGPFLYRLKFENNDITKEWVEDAQVQAWLDSWDYKRFVRDAIQDFNYMQGFFAKYFSSRGRRLSGGKPWIAKLECEPINDCRLEWPENDGRRLEDITNILVGDFEGMSRTSLKRYPVFNFSDPVNGAVSMAYHSFRSFARNFYALPGFIGAIPWIRRANDIPDIIQYLTDNMIAAAYHVHEPAQYWEDKRNYLRETYPEDTDLQIEKRIDLLRDSLTKTLANVLAGKRNVGKFIETVDFIDDNGQKCEWKIEPIEMNIDKYIEAQTKISRIADSSTTSGMGINPALSNIIIDGKGDSGSQMLYALKIFYAADTQICEDIVFEPIHQALKINFPGKNLSMGLYRKVVNKEDNVTASQRTTNQV